MADRRVRGASLLVWLAPLAAVVGIWLIASDSIARKVDVGIARRDVVRMAHERASAHNLAAEDWRVRADLKADNTLRHYLAKNATPAERASIERIFAPIVFRCVLENPENVEDSPFINVSPRDGRLMSWRVPPTTKPVDVSETIARRAAEAELRERLGAEAASFTFASVGVQKHEATASDIRRFSFRRKFSNDLEMEARVDTSGDRVVGFALTPTVAAARTKGYLELNPSVQMFRGFAIALLVLGGIGYVVVRFVRRLREQEIPLKRAAIVVAFVFIAFTFSSLAGGETQRIDNLIQGTAAPTAVDTIMIFVVSALMGLLIGVTWGACEADVREAYPEKLISTDALLGGVFSAPAVRTSLTIGLTFAGYAIFLAGIEPFLRERLGVFLALATGELLVYQVSYPALAILLFSVSNLPVLTGLLLAAVSATHRRGRTRFAKLGLAALVLFFFFLTMLSNHDPSAWGVLPMSIAAAGLLVPFFLADVLAVLVVSCVGTWATMAAWLIAQDSPAHRPAGWIMLGFLALIVIATAVAAFRRRRKAGAEQIDEEEEIVIARPEYARNIAERLMLTNEMETARQAQLRVMPRVVPKVEGVKLATKHASSGEIGTDYCEFFPSPTHVSVAVADARLAGLSSALCISMLKGLLLNYAARLDNPRDLADRVYRQLSSIFGDDLPLSFFFGRLDRATGQFLFASFGNIPHAVLIGNGGATSLEGEEVADLRANDGSVVIYTATLPELRDRDGNLLTDIAIRNDLTNAKSADPQRLLDAIEELATRHTRGLEVKQSWTAVALASEVTR